MNSASLNNATVKAEALRLGFSACGLSPAEPVEQAYAQHYLSWLQEGHNADMQYMQNHVEMRLDPRLLVPGVRTIVSVALNYFPSQAVPGISMYAQGQDYHDVMRARLQQLMDVLHASGRCFVDSAPVLERYWAWRAGLGWQGRNTQLIIPHLGSTYFLGEMFLMEEADCYDSPLERSCGSCHLCMDACPVGALSESGLDARRCISYLTIENRGSLPDGLKLKDTFYGCDCCQRACPHLRHAQPTKEAAFLPSEALRSMTDEDWKNLTVEQYRQLFKGSAVKRAKYEGLMRNIKTYYNEEV